MMKFWQASPLAVATMLALSLGSTEARAEAQPRMRASLRSLEAAKTQLESAAPDKTGHRAKALAHINAAIAQVKQGIAADSKTPAKPGAKTTTTTTKSTTTTK